MAKNKHMGSGIDDFLKEEGVLEEFQAQAVKEVIAWQLGQAMQDQKLSKRKLAALMHSGQSGDYRGMPPGSVAVLRFPLDATVEPGVASLAAFWWP